MIKVIGQSSRRQKENVPLLAQSEIGKTGSGNVVEGQT